MDKVLVAVCKSPACTPCLEAEKSLGEAGFIVWGHIYLCSPVGLQQLRQICKRERPKHLVVATCAEVIRQGLITEALAGHFARSRIHLLNLDSVSLPDMLLGQIRAVLSAGPEAARRRGCKHKRALVIGGGVGGCQVALDLADGGIPVTLLENRLSIGGLMAKLDKTFPTLDCSICILGPKLVEVANHPGIDLLTNVEVKGIKGGEGNFIVDVYLRPRYVDMTKCKGCGKCMEVCPVVVPSEWNLNMKPTKCIHISFEQSVPLRSAINRDYCIECKLCEAACEREAINFDDPGEEIRLQVGAIALATGVNTFDPSRIGSYGYGQIPGVITNLEFERLVSPTGPTVGHLQTPDGREVKSLAFVQCVGSRDHRFQANCSGYCCTASIKEAMLAIEHVPDAKVSIFFNDIRTAGKGFEELYQRAKQAGIQFIKGLPGAIRSEDGSGRCRLVYDDMVNGRQKRLAVDLVVLAVGMEPRGDQLPWPDELKPDQDSYGFYQEHHLLLHPLESSVPGIYMLGTCRGPKDIPETVADASGVAAKIMAQLARG